MGSLTSRDKRQFHPLLSQPAIELLENRRLLSGSIMMPFDTNTSPVAGLAVSANAGSKFKDVVGTWTNANGLPQRGSGVKDIAIIDWGDGKTSHGKFVDDGSGVIQITGVHHWAKPGTFQTVVKVEEITKHPHQITEVGSGDGSAVVAPKSHGVSIKGTFTGTYTAPLNNPDARSYNFTGTGTAGTLGATDLSGTISPPGFIKSAPATGEFTLTTDPSAATAGSVTIDLTGATQPGGSPVPQEMKYKITAGTGAFANAGGKGTVSIALDDTAGTFVIIIH